MPRAVAGAVREVIFRRMQQGQGPTQIADELDLPRETVRSLVKRLKSQGEAGLATAYCRRGNPCQDYLQPLAAAARLRTEHPGWGAGLIHVKLMDMFAVVPSTRTIERHLAKLRLQPAPRARRQGAREPRAREPHHTWQIDAADQMQLKEGHGCWLRVTDEASGAVLKTVVFPPTRLECDPCP